MSEQTVEVDGVRYVRADQFGGEIKIVVIDNGFVYIGRVEEKEGRVNVSEARCFIRWGTTKHLAELENGPTEQTKLGDESSISVPESRVVLFMEVSQDGWANSC